MKNCTKHFVERWVERVLDITDKNTRDEYIRDNRDMIIANANKTFEFATYLYKGQIGDNISRNYYIKDNTVFVTNTGNDALITVYQVDLGFTDELNTTVRKGLIKEIVKLSAEKEEIEFQILTELEDKKQKLESFDDEIGILKEKIKNLESQKEFAKQEIKNIEGKSIDIGLSIKRFVLMLVNSKDYKKDLQDTRIN